MADDKAKVVAVGGVSGFTVLVILFILFALWMVNNGPNKISPTSNGSTSSQSSDLNQNQEKTYSPYHNQISLQTSSVYTDIPSREYITLSAHGNKSPINIGGWTLKNGRSNKTYIVTGNAVQGQSVSVKIPSQGVRVYNPFSPYTNIHSAITLKAGERAVITTGRLPNTGSVTVTENFKINRCLGYLEDRPVDQTGSSYRFIPSLRYNCPTSRDLSSIDNLDDVCYSFVRSIAGCHQPTDVYDKTNGYCLDRNCKLSNYCRTFIKDNFNPQTCFKLYSADQDFVGPEWRIFLNRDWELWDRQRETIYLYDRDGLLVTEVSY